MDVKVEFYARIAWILQVARRVPVISNVFVVGLRIQFSEGRKAGGGSEVSTCIAGKCGVGLGLSALPLRE
jgi:hypothetical protein